MQPRPAPRGGRRNSLQDVFPVVFPEPAGMTRPDSYPPEFDQNSDVVVDPFGNVYCFVCQVSVPKGSSNISQHLGGKRHEVNNRRFTSPQQKAEVRERVQEAAREQRAALPPMAAPTTVPPPPPEPARPALALPVVAVQPVVNVVPATAIPSVLDSLPGSNPASQQPSNGKSLKRAKKMQLMERYRRFSIDKGSFLSSILVEGDSDDETDDRKSDAKSDGEESESDVAANPRTEAAVENRHRPFGPLPFHAAAGSDNFFDSIAPESALTETAANIKKVLARPPAKAATSGEGQNHMEADEGEIQPTEAEGDGLRADQLSEFIKFGDVATISNGENEEEKAQQSRLQARESMEILRDVNGEELPPWLLDPEATMNVLQTPDSSVALHFEILQYASFVSPTASELQSRNEMVMMIESVVKKLWPASTALVFGSYATGLYLPSSDIDVCVMGTPAGGELKELQQLAEAVRNLPGFARRVNVLSSAKVPLVKIISRKTSMNCDICIGQDNGPKNVQVIKKYLETYPALRPLLLVVKSFLKQRDLNEVFRGGLGSYTIFLLVASHLQMLKYNFPDCKTNLGAVLQKFFHFYGRMFNLCIAGIQVKDNGSYFDKFDKYETVPQETMRFSIEDPNDETNELGNNGYATMNVRKAFSNASQTLIHWRRDDATVPPTPLNAILKYDDDFLARRASVILDMERKGLKFLRASVGVPKSSVANPEPASRSQQSSAANEEGQSQGSASRRRSEGVGFKREHRDTRDRDPRLQKRRRASLGNELESGNNAGNGTYYNANDANYATGAGLNNQNSHGSHNSGAPNAVYRNSSGPSNHGAGRGYAPPQLNYANVPVQQYPVSTPGYQYDDRQGYGPHGANGQGMYPNAQGFYMPQGGPQFSNERRDFGHRQPFRGGGGWNRGGRGAKKRTHTNRRGGR